MAKRERNPGVGFKYKMTILLAAAQCGRCSLDGLEHLLVKSLTIMNMIQNWFLVRPCDSGS